MPNLISPERAHPAQFSQEVLLAIAPWIGTWHLPVHDPFAGPGVRLGQLCDHLGVPFTGTEIQADFIVDPRVVPGDSTKATTYPMRDHVIVTSPVYPNGIADHFKANDDSRRHTYRKALSEIIGHDRELEPNNMGRYSIRGGKRSMASHLNIAHHAVTHWRPHNVVLNVSNFIHAGGVVDLVGEWRKLLTNHGYIVTDEIPVQTRRQRYGANAEARYRHETVLIAIYDIAEEHPCP